MKQIYFIILCILVTSCELFHMKEEVRIQDATELIRLFAQYDSINPLINEQIIIDIKLDSIKVANEQDIIIKTDQGSLSEIPFRNSGNTQNQLTIHSAGLKATAVLKITPEINNNITITASIEAGNSQYTVYKQIYLLSFKPDKISLSIDKDSLNVTDYSIVKGDLFSYKGKVSDNLDFNFSILPLDSAMATIQPATVKSTNQSVSATIWSQNQKPGYVKLICSDGTISDTLLVKFFE